MTQEDFDELRQQEAKRLLGAYKGARREFLAKFPEKFRRDPKWWPDHRR